MSNRNWALLIALSVIWGGSFYFGRVAVLEIPPFTVVFFRVFLAAITLWLIMVLSGRAIPLGKHFVYSMLLLSIINNVIPFSFILYGQKEIGAGLAALVNAMTPIWTLIIANFLTLDEKFSANRVAGIILGFVGVGVLMGADILAGLLASALAQGMVLIATISYGFAGVFGKTLKQYGPTSIATGQLTASSLLMLPIALYVDTPWELATPSILAIISVIGIAVLCTALAYVIYFTILESAGATFLSLVTFLVPVSAIVLGALLLGEKLTVYQLIGMVLIAAGLVVIDGRFTARRN